jgi:hypothetical protein
VDSLDRAPAGAPPPRPVRCPRNVPQPRPPPRPTGRTRVVRPWGNLLLSVARRGKLGLPNSKLLRPTANGQRLSLPRPRRRLQCRPVTPDVRPELAARLRVGRAARQPRVLRPGPGQIFTSPACRKPPTGRGGAR